MLCNILKKSKTCQVGKIKRIKKITVISGIRYVWETFTGVLCGESKEEFFRVIWFDDISPVSSVERL